MGDRRIIIMLSSKPGDQASARVSEAMKPVLFVSWKERVVFWAVKPLTTSVPVPCNMLTTTGGLTSLPVERTVTVHDCGVAIASETESTT